MLQCRGALTCTAHRLCCLCCLYCCQDSEVLLRSNTKAGLGVRLGIIKEDEDVVLVIQMRRTSMDELPQIFNVLAGDMSLVGPRPIVAKEIEMYGARFEFYKQVLPGIAGLWQISGRNDLLYSERVDLDEYYVRNWSIWMDIYILLETVQVVLTGLGAY